MNLNNPLNGLFRIEISAPNVLYGTNICAVKKEDLPELSDILSKKTGAYVTVNAE